MSDTTAPHAPSDRPAARSRRRTLSRVVKGLVSLAFFLVLFRFVRATDFAAMVRRIDPLFFLLSLAIVPVMIGTSCLKWKLLLDLQGHRAGFWFLMRCYLVGYYFSNLLPSNVGGDVVRSWYAGRRIGSQGHAAVSVFLERFIGILLLLALVVVAPLLRPGLYRLPTIWVPAIGAVGLLLLFAGMLALRDPLGRGFGLLHRLAARLGSPAVERLAAKLHGRAVTFGAKLADGVRGLRRDPGALLAVAGLTVLFYALAGVNVWLAFRTFRAEPSLLEVASVLPTSMTVAMVPVTLGSLGIAEGSYVYFYGLLGMAPAASLAMALLLRFKMILAGTVGFLFHLAHRHEEGTPPPPERGETAV